MMSRTNSWLILTVVVSLATALQPPLRGESVMPLGGDFQVNSYTTGPQGGPSIAAAPDGRFVVIWGGPEIAGRRFAADGTPQGEEFQVNTVTEDLQTSWDVAMAPDGSFMVVFNDRPSGSTPDSIQARIFDADGEALEPEFQVAVSTLFSPFGQYVRRPLVEVDSQGEFVVVWTDAMVECLLGYCGVNSAGMAQRLSLRGSPVGTPFQVSPGIPYLARRSSGDFIVVWPWIFGGVEGQRFDPRGHPVGGRFEAPATGPVAREFSLAMNDAGEFVVAWSRGYVEYVPYPPFHPLDIRARRFAANAEELGGEFVVATAAYSYGPPYPRFPDVAVDADSGFVIVWSHDSEIYGRAWGSGGDRDVEFAVNSYTSGIQSGTDIVFNGSGRFIVAWNSIGSPGSDVDNSSIQARMFLRTEIFDDDFESGGSERWSRSVP